MEAARALVNHCARSPRGEDLCRGTVAVRGGTVAVRARVGKRKKLT